MMDRDRADRLLALVVSAVLVFGGALAWQAYQQSRTVAESMGSMMGASMGAVHGTNPLWYVLGALLTSAVVVGLYLTIRDGLPADPTTESQRRREDGSAAGASREPPDAGGSRGELNPVEAQIPEKAPLERILDLLPEDERRVLKPVLASPGITQIELRDRSDFSKSKVSQTVTALEKRGLLYRERQGRTYRIYPSDELRRNRD